MDDTVILVFLAIVMLIGSFLAGIIPLVVTLSEVLENFHRFSLFANEFFINFPNGTRQNLKLYPFWVLDFLLALL